MISLAKFLLISYALLVVGLITVIGTYFIALL